MRIGFFSPTINRIGGGEWVTLNMIHALKAKKHKILVYSAEKINPYNIQKFFGHNLHFDNEVSFWPNIYDPYNPESIYPNLIKSFLFSLKCDLLIDTFSNAVFPWADAVYFQGRPKITRLPKGMKGSLFTPYKAFLTNSIKHVKPDKKTLMACSKYTAKTIEALTGLTVNVLYPPVSDFFKIGNKLSSKNNTVVTVTRISNDKRPETIPQIAKLAPDNISFVIIGSCRIPSELNVLNNLQEYIRKLGVSEKVKLLLNASREEQREILQKSKVYLHPFVPYEAFGISVIEAMSAGCVPIAPDIAGLKETVPKQLRYTSLEEAASLIEESITNWSPSKAQDSVKIADKFSQAKFCAELLRIMKL
jgi:glycosyltransferase involved in cell wall biosynthesis